VDFCSVKLAANGASFISSCRTLDARPVEQAVRVERVPDAAVGVVVELEAQRFAAFADGAA